MRLLFFSILSFFFITENSFAKKEKEKDNDNSIYSGLKFRGIGPALMSGRISDIIIHPKNENIWYVTAGSGGVWKTENSGTTWDPIFDDQKSYSIGCISMDPQNSNVLWVGTGENVGGRHVGYGDGIYKSDDGGQTWTQKGLKNSEHISKILIHPSNSDVIWVASQGPLWSKGGDRGLYKSKDGGKTWQKKLGDDQWVGATDLLIDSRNPDILYAATWQRHRTVAGYMGGGPGTAIYKSTDGGENWIKLTKGLPTSNMGKIGLAMSYQNNDIIYAAIELDRRTGGVFRSEDQGLSWKKMSDAVAGGTGPHYYQELYTSPHKFDKLYLVDNYMQISNDGGKTFSRMNENEKHVDNHAIAFKKNDPNYILVGCDGGLYESFDNTENWKFVDNLPLTQFYKIAVDDSKPFYKIYGGTQDNNTQGAPSRTDNIHGIRNSDWFILLGGDGHQPATEPGNPNIVYVQWQRGNLNRHDRITGENINIKPQPSIGEKTERYNWDSPIIVSPHDPKRIYFASQRIWRSDNRGDKWNPISEDLTKNIQRVQTKFYDKFQKWDNAWDLYAMSNYSTITSISESPIVEGLIYAGTDDGLIQVTEDGGESWSKIDFKKINGLPEFAFVNDIKADLFDENKVYAVFDNHKYGDFKPYIFMSSNKGKTWQNISENLPKNTILWRVVQDHVRKDLFFLGTEFGVYFKTENTQGWVKLSSGMPNIAVRDLAIQKRQDDLVAGTFGRGIYILDDYSSLRTFDLEDKDNEAILFNTKDTYWYLQKRVLGGRKKASQGDNYFVADNPPYGVNFTYFLAEKYSSSKEKRISTEKNLEKENKEFGVPSWNTLDKEEIEVTPSVWLFISSKNEIIKKIKLKNKKGINRANWDFSTHSITPVTSSNIDRKMSGPKVGIGTYSSQIFKLIEGEYIAISSKQDFYLKPLQRGALNGSSNAEVIAFWNDVYNLRVRAYELSDEIKNTKNEIDKIIKSYHLAKTMNSSVENSIKNLRENYNKIDIKLNGSKSRSSIGEQNDYPSLWTYLWSASGSANSSYGPTDTHKQSYKNAKSILTEIKTEFKKLENQTDVIKNGLKNIKAPVVKDY